MIKGVNKHVIELLETGNMYYEKALLFVKPEYANVERKILIKEAKKVLKDLDTISAIKERKKLTPFKLCAALIIVLVLFLVLLLTFL